MKKNGGNSSPLTLFGSWLIFLWQKLDYNLENKRRCVVFSKKNLRMYTEVIYHVLRAERKSTSLNLENPPDFSRVPASQSFVIWRREQFSVKTTKCFCLPALIALGEAEVFDNTCAGSGAGEVVQILNDLESRMNPRLRPSVGHQRSPRSPRPVAVPASGLYTVKKVTDFPVPSR